MARIFAQAGMRVALAARNPAKLAGLAKDLNAEAFACDASKPAQVAQLFTSADAYFGGAPDVVVYNPSARVRGSIVDIEPDAVADAIAITAYGGFLVAQQAAKRMVPRGSGAILFTGASASVKGYPLSASFAMGKFALRGLAQSIARELAPKGVHVAHFVIDGGIRSAARPVPADAPDSLLDPDAIAQTYLQVLAQDRSAWTWEIELRPWVEKF
ncbi:MAG: short-chain dehydrogenase/reductase [Betaproteobacteria bacterium]|nr:short-chain dehydrogenase/reductase [Betaproteobacteria bacterium]